MELIIISGRSGSGKSVALRVVEDLGYYCVDNIPLNLLPSLVRSVSDSYNKIAVSVDVRNLPKEQQQFNEILEYLPGFTKPTVFYLDSDDQTLIKRFSEYSASKYLELRTATKELYFFAFSQSSSKLLSTIFISSILSLFFFA